MTSGEKRFAHRVEQKLDDNCLCWFDVPVGPRSLHPDFMILHPSRGLLILEIKDWKLESMSQVSKTSVTLLTAGGLKETQNPMEQARTYAHAVVDCLEKDPALVGQPNNGYRGKLIFPWGYGVVFSNITRKTFESRDLGEAFQSHQVICQDEMTESVDDEEFQDRLWRMFNHSFGRALTVTQIDRIRWHLFPEIRIDPKQLSLFEGIPASTQESIAIPNLLRVMDLQQEQLARSLGEGHRVIHGVAGSGKTLILGYRCCHLAEANARPILVVCFNVSLASKLKQIIVDHGLSERVTVRHFHGWCADQLRSYKVSRPDPGAAYHEEMVRCVIDAVDSGSIPRGQYGAVMIDEGHDFKPEWLKLIAQMVDPETNSLLVVYDNAQSIYGKSSGPRFTFSSLGIQARGRTSILRLNYRNTTEVISLAYEFAREVFTAEEKEADDIDVVTPQSAGRSGAVPVLLRFPSLDKEAGYIARRLQEIHDGGIPWNAMAIVYRRKFIGEVLAECLRGSDIPVEWLQESKDNRNYRPHEQSVKIVTMHSSKGLEFRVVAIPGLGYMPQTNADLQDEARLLYVAMTRAMDELILTSHKESLFVARLGTARKRVLAISMK